MGWEGVPDGAADGEMVQCFWCDKRRCLERPARLNHFAIVSVVENSHQRSPTIGIATYGGILKEAVAIGADNANSPW